MSSIRNVIVVVRIIDGKEDNIERFIFWCVWILQVNMILRVSLVGGVK